MRAVSLLVCFGAGFLFDLVPSLASAEEDRQKQSPHHLNLALPPLHPDSVLVASNNKPTPKPEPAKGQSTGSEVPPPDPKTDEDDIDDTKLEADVEPHVEEDSALALDDMGDVGGDFEE